MKNTIEWELVSVIEPTNATQIHPMKVYQMKATSTAASDAGSGVTARVTAVIGGGDWTALMDNDGAVGG